MEINNPKKKLQNVKQMKYNAETIKNEGIEIMESKLKANKSTHNNFICKQEIDDEELNIYRKPKTENQCDEVCYDTCDAEPNSEVDEKIDISEITFQSIEYNDNKSIYEDEKLRSFASKQLKNDPLWEQKKDEIGDIQISKIYFHQTLNKPFLDICISSSHKTVRSTMKCQFCIKSFVHQKSFDEHLLKQHQQNVTRKIHTCNICFFKTTSKYKLDKHFNSIHNEEKTKINCQICDKSFKFKTSLNHHLLTQHKQEMEGDLKSLITSNIYKCNVCSYQTTDKCNRDRHFNSIHNEQSTKITCQICDKSFTKKQYLYMHLLKYHEQEIKGDLRSLLTTKMHNCNICSYKTTLKYKLDTHFNSVHNEQKAKNNCQICDKSFVLKTSLDNHLLKQHKQEIESVFKSLITSKIHKCNFCCYQTVKNNLNVHLSSVHNRQKTKINCKICDKSFSKKRSLDHHLLNKHKQEIKDDFQSIITSKIHKCNSCSYKTTNKCDLHRHFNSIHNEQKTKINCKICDKSFSKKRSLDHHLLNKHKQEIKDDFQSIITSKIHKCNSCSYKTTNKCDLHRHLMNKKPTITVKGVTNHSLTNSHFMITC